MTSEVGKRVIIAGSSTISNAKVVREAIERAVAEGLNIGEVVCGDGPGVDTHGMHWAEDRGIPVSHHPARWTRGKRAGVERNLNMAVYATTGPVGGALILVWTGDPETSPGSAHMLRMAKQFRLPVYETIISKEKRT